MNTKVFPCLLWLSLCLACLSVPTGLVAQDTVIGLNFEMSYPAAADTLFGRGFIAESRGSNYFLNKSAKTQVKLIFAGKNPRLKCIYITIEGDDTDALEEQAIQMLSQFHGEDYDYDQEMREAWWKLDEYHFLNAAAVEDDGNYVIFYGDIREEELIPY